MLHGDGRWPLVGDGVCGVCTIRGYMIVLCSALRVTIMGGRGMEGGSARTVAPIPHIALPPLGLPRQPKSYELINKRFITFTKCLQLCV